MSCEYGKQRGYDYDYTRNSVDERAAEGQYLRHDAIHMHDYHYTRNGVDERAAEGQYLRHGAIHMPCIESKDHQPNDPVGKKSLSVTAVGYYPLGALRHQESLAHSCRVRAATRTPRGVRRQTS